jgi:hypothetical protein
MSVGWVHVDPSTNYVSGGTDHYATAGDARAAAMPTDTICALVPADEYDQAAADRAALERVRALHSEWRIYDECGHKHTDEDVTAGRAKHVNDVGTVCEDGLMYVVCRHCCTDDGGYQIEDCLYHAHGPEFPRCATIATIDGPDAHGSGGGSDG